MLAAIVGLTTTIVCGVDLVRFPLSASVRWPERPASMDKGAWERAGCDELSDEFKCCGEDVVARLRDSSDRRAAKEFWKRNAVRIGGDGVVVHGGRRPERYLRAYKVGMELYLLITDDGSVHAMPRGRLYSFFAYDGMDCRRLADFDHFPTKDEFAVVSGARTDCRAASNLALLYADGVAWTNAARAGYAESVMRVAAETGDPAVCRNLAALIERKKGSENAQVRKWLKLADEYGKRPPKDVGTFPVDVTSWPEAFIEKPDIAGLSANIRRLRESVWDEMIMGMVEPTLPFEAYVADIDRGMKSERGEDQRDAMTVLALIRRQKARAMERARDGELVRRKTREWICAALRPNSWAVVRERALETLNRLPPDEFAAVVDALKNSGVELQVTYGRCIECEQGRVEACTRECTACGGEECPAGRRPQVYCTVCGGVGCLREKVPCRRCGGKWERCPSVNEAQNGIICPLAPRSGK